MTFSLSVHDSNIHSYNMLSFLKIRLTAIIFSVHNYNNMLIKSTHRRQLICIKYNDFIQNKKYFYSLIGMYKKEVHPLMKQPLNIAFIGAGSMAEAMISGLISTNKFKPGQIHVTNYSNDARLHELRNQYKINITRNIPLIIQKSDVIVLAVKPKDVVESIENIKPYIHKSHLIISVLAGVSTSSILSLFQHKVPVVRAMPNTSASIGLSATAISKGEHANDEHIKLAETLFHTVGTVTVVPEAQLHAVTGLSGSGPAYVYYLVEAMQKAALHQGLESDVATDLITQTLIGAAQMLRTSPKSPTTLRKEVTSPGGTTEAGLEQLTDYEFQEALIQCIDKATLRSKELGEAIDEKMMSSRTSH